MSRSFFVALTIGVAAALAVSGQYPAPYPRGPYPTGQNPPDQERYPPGQAPSAGRGIPLPHRHKKGQSSSQSQQPTLSAQGNTVSNDGKKLVVATEDGRTLTMAINPETKFTRSGSDITSSKIVPRTTVHVDAAEDEDANLTAVKVELLKDAPPEQPAEARAQVAPKPSSANADDKSAEDDDMARSTILKNPVDVPNRPVLKRGKPKQTAQSDDSDDVQVSRNQPPPKPNATSSAKPAGDKETTDFTIDDSPAPETRRPASSDLLSRTREWAQTFTNGLPNFVCQQMTTRYMQQSKSSGWQPLDVVTAKVVYEDGKEDYKEITVGGKRTNKSMLELGGSTSTGEFASTLRSLFSEASGAEFKLYQSTTIAGSPAAIYDFKVPLRRSDWFINVGGQSLRPAYSGSVWIDKATAQVRRIEMQANSIPADFPLDTVEWAVDYDSVRLGTASFLLPVHAENLGCQRGSTICTKNSIDFRDYHKYSGESTVTFK